MVVVKIELWPHGNVERRRELGSIRISNDGTGTERRGNYLARFFGRKGQILPGRTVVVSNFARQSNPVFALLLKVLQQAGY